MTGRKIEKKKKKLNDKSKKLQIEWENLYIFIQVNEIAVCLICCQQLQF